MSIRLFLIITLLLSSGAIIKTVIQQINFIGDHTDILTASIEINEIVKIIYIDYIVTGRHLRYLDQDKFIKYIEKRLKKDNMERSASQDPWLMPYQITVNSSLSYEIRSAGPDLQFDTADDIFVAN